jgi:hypothetical protein
MSLSLMPPLSIIYKQADGRFTFRVSTYDPKSQHVRLATKAKNLTERELVKFLREQALEHIKKHEKRINAVSKSKRTVQLERKKGVA